jgi:hypothetical protein
MDRQEHTGPTFERRRFIANGIKLALFAGILSPLEQACNNKTKTTDKKKTKDKSNTVAKNSKRRKWNAEKLLINTKTKVIHLPTASFYVYYDEIKSSNNVTISDWESQVKGQTRFNKDKSGNILEILSLQKLRNGIDENSLNGAINTLTIAFGKECENSKGINLNTTNYRLHELMLQLIALNSYMPFKWKTFNDMVRKPEKLGKRQSWMADEKSFDQRVKYIQDREAEYKTRLAKRASKYNLT